MARTPQPLSREREARIFDAAAHAFVTQGFEASSLNRIIETAGMPKSSFYHYFTDKSDLHNRLLLGFTTAFAEYVHPPDLAALDATSFWDAMHGLVGDLDRMAMERPETVGLARALYASPHVADATAARLRDATRSWTEDALERGAALGVVRRDLPLPLLGDIAFAVLLVIDRWALDQDARPDTAAAGRRALAALRQLLEGT
jgi:AcrR family transcriptional regulator